VAQWLRFCVANRKVAGSIPAGVSGSFIDIKFFRSHYGPGVDSASNRNEYQEYFLGIKTAGAVVTKSGNLNFLEPSVPVQACSGTDFPLQFCKYEQIVKFMGEFFGCDYCVLYFSNFRPLTCFSVMIPEAV